MQKVANRIIDRMITEHLTNKEIDFFLYISRFQDETGKVSGVYYKEVCEAMRMSYQEFYNAMRGLEQKEFIRCEKANRIDHDITILDNIYAGRERDYESEGYINTNHNIFYCEDFRLLKAGAKLLAMLFMQIGLAGTKTNKNRSYKIGTKTFYEKYIKLLGVSKRVVRSYLKELKQFFSIGIKEKMYYITPKRVVEKKKYAKTEIDNYREHHVEVVCRRNRIREAEPRHKKELRDLLGQYKRVAEEVQGNLMAAFARAVQSSLEIINEGTRGTWKRSLNIKLVHRQLRKQLGIA